MPWVDGAVFVTTRTSPFLAHLDGGVDHQVVPRMARHRDRRTSEASALLDRADLRPDESATTDRLVDRRRPCRGEPADDVRIGPTNVTDDDMAIHHDLQLMVHV